MNEAKITIRGMSCGHCVAGVRQALEALPGVEVREVTVGSAAVAYDPRAVSPEQLSRAVESGGYAAEVAPA